MQVDALLTGVIRFGEKEWKLILYVHRDELRGRTSNDLGDKWRSLNRSGNLPFKRISVSTFCFVALHTAPRRTKKLLNDKVTKENEFNRCVPFSP